MTRMVRALSAIAVAAAAACGVAALSGEPSWDTVSANSVVAGEPAWEGGPAGIPEPSWEVGPATFGEPSWDSADSTPTGVAA
ncbi:hypothetical protein [Streptomyces sp. DH12]|jgi:hypothetical protein|uniref:hypothetical protein n=1 Tax=Streptomyces sp. DH12 TaxID=2857010 RepID=UPI001E367CE8|nr:hypothetical protein [Streptomyces sp. DH12]